MQGPYNMLGLMMRFRFGWTIVVGPAKPVRVPKGPGSVDHSHREGGRGIGLDERGAGHALLEKGETKRSS